jgi:hypothetical protein
MRKDDNHSNIRMILKESGLNRTSDQFSTHLNDLILEQSRKKLAQRSEVNPWLARIVAGIALIWLAIFLYYARPFSIQPVRSISAIAFILGLWGLLALSRKILTTSISSINP